MESLKRSNSFVFNDSITQSRNDINDSILPQLPAYATKMRQWRQMRQIYFSPGISYLEGQQGGGGAKSRKSVAFCHTGGRTNIHALAKIPVQHWICACLVSARSVHESRFPIE